MPAAIPILDGLIPRRWGISKRSHLRAVGHDTYVALSQTLLAIKAWDTGRRALCVGYTNDYLGYFAPPSAWEDGGYEVSLGSWSQAGPEAPERLLSAGRDLVRQLS